MDKTESIRLQSDFRPQQDPVMTTLRALESSIEMTPSQVRGLDLTKLHFPLHPCSWESLQQRSPQEAQRGGRVQILNWKLAGPLRDGQDTRVMGSG